MDEDWGRVAAAVEARLAELRMDRTGLAKRAKIDRKTVDNFLDRGMKPRTDKRGGYEDALGWGYGSMLVVARGGEPDVWPLDHVARLHEAARRLEEDRKADLAEENSRPEGEIDRSSVGRRSEDESYVADRGPNDPPARITDEELLAVIRRQREELDELERRLTGGRPVDGAS